MHDGKKIINDCCILVNRSCSVPVYARFDELDFSVSHSNSGQVSLKVVFSLCVLVQMISKFVSVFILLSLSCTLTGVFEIFFDLLQLTCMGLHATFSDFD